MKAAPVLLILPLLAACGDAERPPESDGVAPTGAAEPISAQQLFFERIAELCGRAFAGRVVADEPAGEEPSPFADRDLVMHVRECSEDEIRIPFHVGEDRSRTWVITRIDTGIDAMDALRLKHDHRHEDGTPDAITMYGGDTASGGTSTRQEFPIDAESRELFEAHEMIPSLSNTWAIEIDPDRFLYELARPEGRLFQVEFDLTQPVPPPPAPWGRELTKVPDPAAI